MKEYIVYKVILPPLFHTAGHLSVLRLSAYCLSPRHGRCYHSSALMIIDTFLKLCMVMHATMKESANIMAWKFVMFGEPVRFVTSADLHYNDVIMGAMASQITSIMIVYPTVYSRTEKRNIKAPRFWPLCGEFTGDLWIPCTKGQSHGKCIHLVTSSGGHCRSLNVLASYAIDMISTIRYPPTVLVWLRIICFKQHPTFNIFYYSAQQNYRLDFSIEQKCI